MRKTSCLLLLFAAACSSTGTEESAEPEPYVPIETVAPPEESIGLFLSNLSASLNAWTSMTMAATSRESRRKQDLIELSLMQQVNKRRHELIAELQSGPRQNRIVAAGALGFSRQPDTLSPLMAALDDDEPKVVTNALMSLGVLQSPETPLAPLCDLLRFAPESAHRWSAANALLNVLQAGARDGADDVVGAARAGLTDAEPMVRTQCALILAQENDADSLDQIAGLLYDEYPLVAGAAARAIGHIGAVDPHAKGRAAHLLFDALEATGKQRQLVILDDLVALTQRNYELDLEEWREYVDRLPKE